MVLQSQKTGCVWKTPFANSVTNTKLNMMLAYKVAKSCYFDLEIYL